MSVRVWSINGVTPVVDATAFVHPSAVLIGDVLVGAGCYIGPCACLRGDFGRIECLVEKYRVRPVKNRRRDVLGQVTISVPIPLSVKISNRMACGVRPSTTCAFFAPPSSAIKQA